MATYRKAEYGSVTTKNGFHESPNQVKWNKLLDRNYLYKFDDSIMDNDYLLTLPLINEIRKLSCATYTIEGFFHERPDMLALHQYGDSDYFWIIMLVNNLSDFDEFTEGKVIKLPYSDALNNWLSDLHFNIEKSKR